MTTKASAELLQNVLEQGNRNLKLVLPQDNVLSDESTPSKTNGRQPEPSGARDGIPDKHPGEPPWKQGALTAEELQDDAVDGELTALITEIALAHPLDRYAVFCECVLEASAWVHQGRLAKPDMVDRFMQAAEAHGIAADYGVVGIQNVLANTLREAAAAGKAALANGHDNDEIASRQDATNLSALPTDTNGTNGTGYREDFSGPEAVANAWEHPDLSYLGTGRSAPQPFPLEVLGEFWGRWCSKHAVARNAPVDYVAGALLAVTGALIGNKRWPYAGGEWGEPPILWVGLVGAPGSGKSPAQDPALDLARHLERDAAQEMAAEVASYKEKLVVAKAAHEKWEQDVKKAFKND